MEINWTIFLAVLICGLGWIFAWGMTGVHNWEQQHPGEKYFKK